MKQNRLFALVFAFTLCLTLSRSVAQEADAITSTLEILSVTPSANAQDANPTDSQIMVMFDRSVVPITALSQPAPLLHIEPVLEGDGEWIHPAVYQFIPEPEAWMAGTIYTVTIAEPLTAVDGSTLQTPYVWSFRTINPQAVDIKGTDTLPNDGPMLLDSSVSVAFSQPMDRESTEAAFTVERYTGPYYGDGYSQSPFDWQPIGGEFSWNDDDTQLTFTPIERLAYSLPYDGSYRAVLTTGALAAAGGASLTQSITKYLTTVTYPAVIAIDPGINGERPPGRQTVEIMFSTPINAETYRGRYSVSPTPVGEIFPTVSDDGLKLMLTFNHVLGEDYTITLAPGIEDIYGTPTDAEFFTTYTVREPRTEDRSSYSYVHPENQPLTVIGDYDAQAVPLRVFGEVEVELDVYRIDFEALLQAERLTPNGYADVLPDANPYTSSYIANPFIRSDNQQTAWARPENRISRRVERVRTTGDEAETHYVGLQDPGQPALPLGVYGLQLDRKNDVVFAVTNAALTLQRSVDELLVWVTDYESAQPIPDVMVKINGRNYTAAARTDADGLVRFPLNTQDGFIFVTTQDEKVFGIWFSAWGHTRVNPPIYVYTDRMIYRPGEPVHFRGAVRKTGDLYGLDYDIPDNMKLYVYSVDSSCGIQCNGTINYQAELVLTDFGTFSDTIQLPPDLNPGNYALQFSTCQPDDTACSSTFMEYKGFTVSEYRVPDFRVSLTPQYDEVLNLEPLNIDVSAQYYFGEAVRDGRFTISGSGYNNARFDYRGSETDYRFGDELEHGEISFRPEQEYPIGESGHYLLTDAPNATGTRPVNLRLEATVFDASGQAISAKSSVLVHPSSLYVGLRLQGQDASQTLTVPRTSSHLLYVNVNTLPADKTATIDVLTVSHESVNQPNQRVEVEIIEKRMTRIETSFGQYRWEYEDVYVGADSLTTDATGRGLYTFTPPYESVFYVKFYTHDDRGRRAQSAVFFDTRQPEPEPDKATRALSYSGGCDIGQPRAYLKLTVDKPYDYSQQNAYLVGETAYVSFENPYDSPATALISVGWGDIRRTETVSLGVDERYTYPLGLTADDAPYIGVQVALMRSPVFESDLPTYISGSATIYVNDPARRLTIDITPSTEIAAAGETVTFDVELTDPTGQPVSAEVALMLTDQAVTDLTNVRITRLDTHFLTQRRTPRLTTTSSNRALLNVPHFDLGSYCGRGGGGGGVAPDSRERNDFVTTPLWEPHIITDEDGRATVSVVMPDNMTEWRFEAEALTTDTRTGYNETTIVTHLPLIVRAIAPRFLVVGDELPLAALVHNNTDQPMQATVTLESQGVTLRDNNAVQVVMVAANSVTRVAWWVTVEDVEGVRMSVSAVSDTGLQDASIPTLTTGENGTIAVYPLTVRETSAASGYLSEIGQAVERIDWSQGVPPLDAALTLTLQSELSGHLLERVQGLELSLDPLPLELAEYIHINAATLDVLDPSFDAYAPLIETVRDSAVRLNAGIRLDSYGMWYPHRGEPYYDTLRTLSALAEVRDLGIVLDSSEGIEAGVGYLRRFLTPPNVSTPAEILNIQAQVASVLAKYDAVTLETLDALYEYRLEMSLVGRALLLTAYLETAPDSEAVSSLISDLTGQAIFTATGSHWEESDAFRQPYQQASPQTTATVLAALLAADPDHPLAPNTIRWLLNAYSDRGLWISEETAWLTLALARWAQAVGETEPDYPFTVALNDSTVSDQVSEQPYQLSFSLSDFDLSRPNDLTIGRDEGTGVLYYTAYLETTYAADQAEAVSRGVRIEREYLRDSDGQAVEEVGVGEVVVVRLTLYVAQDVQYFRLRDTLPAGLEPLDTSLAVTTQQADVPRLRSLNTNDPYWYWGASYWGQTTLYDTGILLRARRLPRGVYTYTYAARAVSAGTFSSPPAVGEAEFQPEVFGRTTVGGLVIR